LATAFSSCGRAGAQEFDERFTAFLLASVSANGKRKLNVRQIREVSNCFGVSPKVFFPA